MTVEWAICGISPDTPVKVAIGVDDDVSVVIGNDLQIAVVGGGDMADQRHALVVLFTRILTALESSRRPDQPGCSPNPKGGLYP